MSNKLFLNSINNIPQSTPPIWFMRQAGRYHSHYKEFKKKYSFEELCKNPELSSEIACGPINEFDFDIAILFSDILFALEGLGMSLKFEPGPVFSQELVKDNLRQFQMLIKQLNIFNFKRKQSDLRKTN